MAWMPTGPGVTLLWSASPRHQSDIVRPRPRQRRPPRGGYPCSTMAQPSLSPMQREVYSRIPGNGPKVRWEVRETREVEASGKPAIRRHVVGVVDSSACPEIKVNISMSLTLPKETEGPVPVLMSFGWTPFEPSPFGPRGPGGGPRPPTKEDMLIPAGWGCATLNPSTVQDDSGGWQPRRFGPGADPDAKPTGAGLTRG